MFFISRQDQKINTYCIFRESNPSHLLALALLLDGRQISYRWTKDADFLVTICGSKRSGWMNYREFWDADIYMQTIKIFKPARRGIENAVVGRKYGRWMHGWWGRRRGVQGGRCEIWSSVGVTWT